MRGRLIVVEGLDRSGKSTQCELLATLLPSSTLLKFPDRTTPIGKMIDAYLKSTSEIDDHVIHLLFSANRWELVDRMKRLIEAGTNVISDRYIYSGVAFSMIKGLDQTWCRAPDVGLPAPDLILFLDVATDVAATRGGFGEERYEKAETQILVRRAFMDLLRDVRGTVVMVDAGKNIEQVQAQIWQAVQTCMKESVEDLNTIQA